MAAYAQFKIAPLIEKVPPGPIAAKWDELYRAMLTKAVSAHARLKYILEKQGGRFALSRISNRLS